MEKMKELVAKVCPHVESLIVEEAKYSPQGVLVYSPKSVLIEDQVIELAQIAKDFNSSWALYPSPEKGVVFLMIDYKRKN